jgi:hypothetical protein
MSGALERPSQTAFRLTLKGYNGTVEAVPLAMEFGKYQSEIHRRV